jgi:outer membrane protein assembly factor BamD
MRLISLLLLSFLVFSCATRPSEKVSNPLDLYVQGVRLLEQKKHDRAIQQFSLIRENYPFDPISSIASVKLGDAYFAKKDYLLASSVYEDFLRLHPEDENVPYVISRLAACYERLSLSVDRDQANTLKAIEHLTYLKNRFPTSSFAREADQRLARLQEKVADREFYVAEFYFKTRKFNAAIWRLEYLLENFPDYRRTDTVLLYLAQSYRELGNLERAEIYARTLKEKFPNSPYVRSLFRERKRLDLKESPSRAAEGAIRPVRLDVEQIELPPETHPEKKGRTMEAIKVDKRKPVEISSDTMEGLENQRYMVFKGNVVVKQEDLFLLCDELTVFLEEGEDEIKKAIAKGGVKILQGDRVATSKEAIFDNAQGEIVLKGDVVVFSGSDRLRGEEVTYYLDEERVTVKGQKEKRANIIFIPKRE